MDKAWHPHFCTLNKKIDFLFFPLWNKSQRYVSNDIKQESYLFFTLFLQALVVTLITYNLIFFFLVYFRKGSLILFNFEAWDWLVTLLWCFKESWDLYLSHLAMGRKKNALWSVYTITIIEMKCKTAWNLGP